MDRKYFDQILLRAKDHAQTNIEKCERRLDENINKLKSLSDKLYRDPDDGARLIQLANESGVAGYIPRRVTDDLRHQPENLGTLRGSFFSPKSRAEAIEAARSMADELEARADELVILKRYEELHARVLEAEHAAEQDRQDAIRELDHEAEYCDATRDSRRAIIERARGPQGPPSDGQAPTSPTDGQNQRRDWWRDGPKPDPDSTPTWDDEVNPKRKGR